MKVRVVYHPDKSVSVIHPAPKSRRPGESEAAWLARVFDKAMIGQPLEGLPYDDLDISALPQSRADRGAWEGEKGLGVSVDPVKAAADREARENEILIAAEIRKQALDSLVSQGSLPVGTK